MHFASIAGHNSRIPYKSASRCRTRSTQTSAIMRFVKRMREGRCRLKFKRAIASSCERIQFKLAIIRQVLLWADILARIYIPCNSFVCIIKTTIDSTSVLGWVDTREETYIRRQWSQSRTRALVLTCEFRVKTKWTFATGHKYSRTRLKQ